MLFQATLIAVIVYLAACYAYGVYLLVKLYTNKRLHTENANFEENPRSLHDNAVEPTSEADAPAREAAPAQPTYDEAAKAA
ncbi:MAG: hypothetical protein AAGH99_11290 [Planctomycetota bacterium]